MHTEYKLNGQFQTYTRVHASRSRIFAPTVFVRGGVSRYPGTRVPGYPGTRGTGVFRQGLARRLFNLKETNFNSNCESLARDQVE
eukprot:1371779-Rhodomonas_salina.7